MIELRNITKTFNLTGSKDDLRVALDNLSLKIMDGEFITVIGGNGSGKTTMMNIITGHLFPDSGQVLLNDLDITKVSEHQRAAYFGRVFQDPMMGTTADMSVLENLEIAYRRGRKHSPFRWGFSKKNKKDFIDELKRFDLGLEDRLTQKVGMMSGGQRQALTLLMATMRNKPTHKMIENMYYRFAKNKEEAKKVFFEATNPSKMAYLEAKKNKYSSKEERKQKILEAYQTYDEAVRKFDFAKQILLLDEHTAALDPKTASKVLEMTNRIVREEKLTTIMITHNMKDAIKYGDRLIMMSSGHIVVDISGEEKKKLTVEQLLAMFNVASEDDVLPDSVILGN